MVLNLNGGGSVSLARYVQGTAPTDAGVAALVASQSSQTRAALNGRYAPLVSTRPGNRWVALGDSITAAQTDNTNNAWGSSWPLYAMLKSQGRLRLVRNAAVGGNTSANMLARFDSDVTPYAPNIVTLLAGTNDIATGVAFATFQANIAAIVTKIRTIGAVPVLGTIPPRTGGGFGPTIVRWNAWLRDYAERNGISVVDFYRTLTDPSTGGYLSAYLGDGVHPNTAGDAALGEVAAWALAELAPVNTPLLPIDSTDTNNLLGSAGLFLTAAGSGVGTGWSPGTAPTGVTKSVVTDAGIKGNFQRLVFAGASSLWIQTRLVTTGFTAGDVVRVVGVVDVGAGTGLDAGVRARFVDGAADVRPIVGIGQPVARGTFCITGTVPAGTTGIDVQLQAGAAGATGVVQFGQVGVYNLTTMGIAA